MTRAALPYPILVALMAYGMFLFSVTGFQPLIARAYETMHMPADRVNSMLLALGHSAALWGPLVPFAVLVPLAIWWHRSRRATFGTTSILRAMPSQRMADYGRMATFAEVLSLLVDHEVPLDESIRLAAEASGDSRLQAAAGEMALDVEQGRAQHVLRDTSATLPPLMRWLLAGRASRPELAAALHRMAETYRRRAERLDERLRLFLPIALSLGIGGTAVILYALSVLVPWYTMLWELPQAPH